MIWLYRILFLPALVLAAPYYLLRMRRRGGYGRHFKQRFGSVPPLGAKTAGVRRIWLQAVSVGEMLAIAPVLEALKKDASIEVYLTTTTSTGYRLAEEKYRECTIGIGYFPIDWWLFSRLAWRKIAPDLVILTEGERWPEHIRQAANRGVPVLCINARMSDVSFRRMKRWRSVARSMLGGLSRVLACSEHDAARFRELGFPTGRITTTGNIKLDLSIARLDETQKNALRAELGFDGQPVILGSSTWPGEERALINAWKEIRAAGQDCRLLIVPRHAERRSEVENDVRASGCRYHFRSRGPASAPVEICVADTTGELRRLTQLADVVFVGKSLPPHDQGQTPVEAAALGKPVVFGPGMTNFAAMTAELKKAGAAREVSGEAGLAGVLRTLLDDEAERSRMASAALAWHRANQGAVGRTVEILTDELNKITKAP